MYCYQSSIVSVASGSLTVSIHYKVNLTVNRMKAKRKESCNASMCIVAHVEKGQMGISSGVSRLDIAKVCFV